MKIITETAQEYHHKSDKINEQSTESIRLKYLYRGRAEGLLEAQKIIKTMLSDLFPSS